MQPEDEKKPAADAGPVDMQLGPLPPHRKVTAHGRMWTEEDMRAYAMQEQAAERERLIRMVEARAQTHNGPHLLTLELNQLAAWMADKNWNGIPPPRA